MTRRPAAANLTGIGPPPERQRRKASSKIIESLRRSIASGDLQRGERLPPEGDLAAHFGVSQPTVREALRVLEAMGLVEVRHGSGAYVTGDPRQFMAASLHTVLQMDRVGIVDLVEMRTALAELLSGPRGQVRVRRRPGRHRGPGTPSRGGGPAVGLPSYRRRRRGVQGQRLRRRAQPPTSRGRERIHGRDQINRKLIEDALRDGEGAEEGR